MEAKKNIEREREKAVLRNTSSSDEGKECNASKLNAFISSSRGQFKFRVTSESI